MLVVPLKMAPKKGKIPVIELNSSEESDDDQLKVSKGSDYELALNLFT